MHVCNAAYGTLTETFAVIIAIYILCHNTHASDRPPACALSINVELTLSLLRACTMQILGHVYRREREREEKNAPAAEKLPAPQSVHSEAPAVQAQTDRQVTLWVLSTKTCACVRVHTAYLSLDIL